MLERAKWIKGFAHWIEGDTVYISVAFTWLLPEARDLCERYRNLGYTVRAGGPAETYERLNVARGDGYFRTFEDVVARAAAEHNDQWLDPVEVIAVRL